jgi:hypothetical protein
MNVEKTAGPSGEVAKRLPSYRHGQNKSLPLNATVLVFRSILWQTLAMVRHIPPPNEGISVPFKYTQTRLADQSAVSTVNRLLQWGTDSYETLAGTACFTAAMIRSSCSPVSSGYIGRETMRSQMASVTGSAPRV